MIGRDSQRTSGRSGGHTLLELMIAILVGTLLIVGAFRVMAAFEGQKRSTTAVNDALQSGNYGLYTIDKLVRSAGSGIADYGSLGWGCGLNYTPNTGTATGTPTVASSATPTLPAPFDTALGTSKLRLVPAVIFPSATTVDGTINGSAAGSDALMFMMGGAGYGEARVPISPSVGPTLVQSNVGFSAGDWVLVGSGGVGDCLITKVDPSFSSTGNNVSLPLVTTGSGSASGLVKAGNYVVGLGAKTAALFVMYGVGKGGTTTATQSYSLWSLDLLNSTLSSGDVQAVSDDVVLMRAIYLVVDPTGATSTTVWTNPVANSAVAGANYDYSPAGLLAGTTAANTALKSIRAVRVAMIVRAPVNEQFSKNLLQNSNGDSISIFKNYTSATQTIPLSWKVPTGNFRYREIEATIPIRNGHL